MSMSLRIIAGLSCIAVFSCAPAESASRVDTSAVAGVPVDSVLPAGTRDTQPPGGPASSPGQVQRPQPRRSPAPPADPPAEDVIGYDSAFTGPFPEIPVPADTGRTGPGAGRNH